MNTVELLEQALVFARRQGFQVRLEPLEGTGGGVCEMGGRRWLFVDLSLSPSEQLEEVLEALTSCKAEEVAKLPPPLSQRIMDTGRSRAA